MANNLTSEVHRMMMLHALQNAHPSLVREIFAANPDNERVLAGLKQHNDALHSGLRRVVETAPEPDTSSNVQPLQPAPRRDSMRISRVNELFGK
jgi:hypothetical protein